MIAFLVKCGGVVFVFFLALWLSGLLGIDQKILWTSQDGQAQLSWGFAVAVFFTLLAIFKTTVKSS